MSLPSALKSQYHASLAMLFEAIELCPADLWTRGTYVNPFWQVAYHTLYYTDLYLQPGESGFTSWEHHRPGHHRFAADADATRLLTPYSREEVAAYGRWCDASVDSAVDRLDLASPDSGFPSYPMTKLEHQLVNLRHLQHHTGQLADRLRQTTGHGVEWFGGPFRP